MDKSIIKQKTGRKAAQALDLRTNLQDSLGIREQNWADWVFEKLDFPETGLLLDIGSGTGQFWMASAGRLPTGLRIVLSDTVRPMLEQSRQGLAARAGQFEFLQASAEHLPVRKRWFDGLLAMGVLDALGDVDRALEQIAQVLKPGARFYAATGASNHLIELCEIVGKFAPGTRLGSAGDAFTLENGKQVLARHFRQVSSWEYHDLLEFPAPEHVMAYIQSEAAVMAALKKEGAAALRRHLETHFEEHSSLAVRAHKILFEGLAG